MIMPITLEEIRRFLGRSLQDPYGRTFGKVVGISADTLVLAPTWKVEAEEFRKEFDVVTRRLKALDELFSVGDIQKDVYEDMRKQHEDAINELKSKRKSILDTLSQRSSTLNTQQRQLQIHLAGNKMFHASGEFDDQSYKAVSDAIDTGLVRAMAERKEVDSIFGYLSKLDSSSSTVPAPAIQTPVAAPSPTPSAPSQPKDQVMVLHVRET